MKKKITEKNLEEVRESEIAEELVSGHGSSLTRYAGYSGVVYSDNADTVVFPSCDTLEEGIEVVLEWCDSQYPDLEIETALWRGLDAVPLAEADSSPVQVLEYHTSYNAGDDTCHLATEDEFDTVRDAQEWIDSENSKRYYTRHGETGRPDYRIISVRYRFGK